MALFLSLNSTQFGTEMTQLNKLAIGNNKKHTHGKDILYVCVHCKHEEKQFALPSRNMMTCQKCGGTAVKSHLVDTLDWVNSKVQPPVESFDE